MRPALLVALATLMSAGRGASGAPVEGAADGLAVRLSADPRVITVGKSTLGLRLSRDGRPVAGARVSVLVRMPGMNMGEREEPARPVEDSPGAYESPAVFAMAGRYVADVKVVADGSETTIRLHLATGMDTGEGTPDLARVYWAVGVGFAAVFGLYTLIRMRRTGQRIAPAFLARRAAWGSLLILGAATAISVYAVRHWRRPGAMTPVEAQAMEMETPPPPGVAPVKLALTDLGPVAETVTYTGQAAGWVEQDIYPRVSGWIVQMPVYVGTRIRTGDLLARLDTSQIRPLLAERSAMARSAREATGVSKAEERQARSARAQASAEARARSAETEAAQSEARASEAEVAEARETLGAARLEIGAMEAMVGGAQADRTYWSAELGRMETLRARGAVSTDEIERTRAQSASAEAQLLQAQARLGQARSAVRSAEARLRRAEAAAESARRKAEAARQNAAAARAALETAAAAQVASKHRAEAARSDARAASAMLADARTSLGYAEIRATADGVVTQRLVAPGVLASPGQAILRIAQERPIRLQAAVSESDLARIRVGARAGVWRSGRPERTTRVRVSSVARLVDRETRTGLVEAVWPNAGNEFIAGESVVLRIEVGATAGTVRVPVAAAREVTPGSRSIEGRARRYAVWVAEDAGAGSYVAKRVLFEPGLVGDGYIEVRGGLGAGQRVVVDGGRDLRDGDRIAAAPEEGTIYTCPMHPDVRRDRPGACPKCGMALVPKEAAR